MAQRTWFDFSEFERLWREMDAWVERIMERPFPRFAVARASRVWLPAVDVCESDNAIHITVELAGVHPTEITVEYQPYELTISGTRHRRQMENVNSCHRLEINYGPFERRIQLPTDIDPDGIKARFDAGLLHITVPKRPANATRESIRVEIKEG
ncbi:MAG TPA: Hsp20/alpha crystallin family protein [Armatimonadetes bacterium]|nr:Hsp20/alpha crystallin family protein [Armatimonadota bacterium]